MSDDFDEDNWKIGCFSGIGCFIAFATLIIASQDFRDDGEMTYLGSEVMTDKKPRGLFEEESPFSGKYLYFDTDGNLETVEEVRAVCYGDLLIAHNLKVGQKVSIKDWRKVLSAQQKTRE